MSARRASGRVARPLNLRTPWLTWPASPVGRFEDARQLWDPFVDADDVAVRVARDGRRRLSAPAWRSPDA